MWPPSDETSSLDAQRLLSFRLEQIIVIIVILFFKKKTLWHLFYSGFLVALDIWEGNVRDYMTQHF